MKRMIAALAGCLIIVALAGCQQSDHQLAERLTELHRVDHTVPTNEPDRIFTWIVPIDGRDDLAVAVCNLDGISQGEAMIVDRKTLETLWAFGGGQAELVEDVSTRRVDSRGYSIVRAYISTARGRHLGFHEVIVHDDNTVEGRQTVSFADEYR
jgi:hypothetical protein